jgi:mycothiol synthase
VSVELRPPVREDAAAIAAALNEFNRPAGFDLDSPEEVGVWLDFPSFDLARDVRVAVDGGKIVGYAEAVQLPEDEKLVFADLRAAPQHGDASAALLDFVEQRARELASPGGRLRIWTAERAEAWRQFLESHGFEVQRYSLRMVADVQDEPPEPRWPEGISVRTRNSDEDDRAAYDVQRETFADQGDDYVPETFGDWLHWVRREPFDPALWFLAFDGDQLAGVCLCRGEWACDAEMGSVSVVGVRRPWRRKGLGSALLLHSFRELHARGKTRVGLGVRADNATGAVRVYERVGMRVEGRQVWYEKAGL